MTQCLTFPCTSTMNVVFNYQTENELEKAPSKENNDKKAERIMRVEEIANHEEQQDLLIGVEENTEVSITKVVRSSGKAKTRRKLQLSEEENHVIISGEMLKKRIYKYSAKYGTGTHCSFH